MYYREVLKSVAQAFALTIILLFFIDISSAQVRSSPSYSIQSDSINVAGGLSDSDGSKSYIQESTVGEIATGRSNSSSYSLRAGYQQMQEVYISVSVSGNVTMSPELYGLTGGESNGSTTLTVVTDSPSGYQLTLKATSSPAMINGAYSIPDYNAGAEADFNFTTGATEANFGFTPEGVDIVQEFLDDGVSACNTDSNDTPLACWMGMSMTPIIIAEGVGSNHPDGATTTVNFRVGIGGNGAVLAGIYTATSTVTALPL